MMLLEKFPSFRASQTKLESVTARGLESVSDLRKAKLITIRTVVNVVYRTDEENVSDAQIRRQIGALNRDFRAKNPDRSKVPVPWKGLVTDARLKFRLVKTTRTRTTLNGFTVDDGVKKASTGGIAPYLPTTHMNMWVCALTGGLLGYAQFPGGPLSLDGVVINYRAFGLDGTAEAPFNNGRTATHEVGHYLNLIHIWADTNGCTGSDMVADTPNCAGPNFGTPSWPSISCSNGPNGDMFMNYMDYTDDAAMFLFTAQQVVRMRTALESARPGLMQSL
ncbi:MAG TPA: zinc metalloprotease [Vicinamibacteria bacterium]|nr:zinc metalloprotease [Vicinamibacteria bacterium]